MLYDYLHKLVLGARIYAPLNSVGGILYTIQYSKGFPTVGMFDTKHPAELSYN